MKHVPFADKPRKSAYMWRDIDRRAAMYGIPVSLPAPYPAKQSIVANLVASVGMREGWGIDFVRAAYRRWLQLGQETGSEPNVSGSLRDISRSKPSDDQISINLASKKLSLKMGFCNGPRFVNPSCVIQSPARASVRGRRMSAT